MMTRLRLCLFLLLGAVAPLRAETAPILWDRVSIAPMKTSIYVGTVTLVPGVFVREGSTLAATYEAKVFPWFFWGEHGRITITLTEADPMSLIRICCQLPYRADGKTDPIARTVMETYVTRMTHEKYASTYHKVVNSLRTMFHAKPNSTTLLNFVALVKWVSPDAATKLCADVGMPEPTH